MHRGVAYNIARIFIEVANMNKSTAKQFKTTSTIKQIMPTTGDIIILLYMS